MSSINQSSREFKDLDEYKKDEFLSCIRWLIISSFATVISLDAAFASYNNLLGVLYRGFQESNLLGVIELQMANFVISVLCTVYFTYIGRKKANELLEKFGEAIEE